LIKIFRQDDKKPFLLTQGFRKKGFIPNQVLKLLGALGREKIRKLAIVSATEMVGRENFGITDEEEKAANSGHANPVPSSSFHQSQYIPKEASSQPLNYIRFRALSCIPRGNLRIKFFLKTKI
jgi:hypothetical protein